MKLLRRLSMILVGFLAACLAVSILLHLRWGQFLPRIGWGGADLHLVIPWFAGLVGLLAALPAGIALIVLERYDLRQWFHAAIAGLLVTISAGMILRALHPGVQKGVRPLLPPLDIYAIDALAAGIAGGLVYWLIAGRRTGATSPGR